MQTYPSHRFQTIQKDQLAWWGQPEKRTNPSPWYISQPEMNGLCMPAEPKRKKVYSCQRRIVKLVTTRNEKLRVVLSKPKANEECPITMSPMQEDSLDFLPDQSFFPNLPHLKKIQLPCGHSFGTMNLLYYFSRNNTMCPNCRAGFPSSLSPACVPCHLVVVRIFVFVLNLLHSH